MKKMHSLRTIRMVILDCDGVLTDGSICIDDDGKETKVFNVADGAGVAYMQRAGLHVAIISGRASMALYHRARELGINEVFQKEPDKLLAFEAIQRKYGLKDEQFCYIGDDLSDIPVMRRVGYAVAVANAHPEVKKIAHFVTRAGGGRGAVRELAEKLLKAQGKWKEVLAKYGVEERSR